jgi:hypothetical protein
MVKQLLHMHTPVKFFDDNVCAVMLFICFQPGGKLYHGTK